MLEHLDEEIHREETGGKKGVDREEKGRK